MDLNTKQQEVLDLIWAGHNVIVQGYAGFGKTTLALAIAAANPEKKVLLLTYNKAMQEETERRRKHLKLANLTCRTFHAYFSSRINAVSPMEGAWACRTDTELVAEYQRIAPHLTFFPCDADLIVLDEFQDASLIIILYLKHIIQPHHQILVLGDARQEIYRTISDADSRFFRAFDELFPDRNWHHVFCNVSMRIPPVGANFINYCLFRPRFGDHVVDYILNGQDDGKKLVGQGGGPGATITYLAHVEPDSILGAAGLGGEAAVRERRIAQKAAIDHIKNWITARHEIDHYLLEEIAILIPTRTNNYLLEELQTWLTNEKNWPYYFPDQKKSTVSERRDKILFSTIHSFKGRERKCVVLLDFSNRHFWRNEHLTTDQVEQIDNLMYVGITRALEHLLVVETTFGNDPRREFRARFNWLPDSDQMASDFARLGITYLDPLAELDIVRNCYPAIPPRITLNVGWWAFQDLFFPSHRVATWEQIVNANELATLVEPADASVGNLPSRIRTNMAFVGSGATLALNTALSQPLVENVTKINTAYLVNELLARDNPDTYPELVESIPDRLGEAATENFANRHIFLTKSIKFWEALKPDLADPEHLDPATKLRLTALSLWVTYRGRFHLFNEVRFTDFHWLDGDGVVGQMVELAHGRLRNLATPDTLRFQKEIRLAPDNGHDHLFLKKCTEAFHLERLTEARLLVSFDLWSTDFYQFFLKEEEISFAQKLGMLYNLYVVNTFREFLPDTFFPPKKGWLMNLVTGELVELTYQKQPLTNLFHDFMPAYVYGAHDPEETMEAFVARVRRLLDGEGLDEWLNGYRTRFSS